MKDKWTALELNTFLVDFLEPDHKSKFDQWLVKNAKSIKEPNPHNPAQMQVLYIKKF